MTIDGQPGKRRVLLTGGRSPAALELARGFRQSGCRVFSAESAPYHLSRVSRAVERSFLVPAPAEDPPGFAEALRAIAVEMDIDVLVPTCEEIFYVAKELGRFEGVCRVFSSPIAELDRLHHKGEFVRTAAKLGLSVPVTETFVDPEGWLPLLDDPGFAEGIVLKPAYSRFAARTVLVDRKAGNAGERKIKETLRRLRQDPLLASGEHPWVAQELLRGEEWCTYSVAHEGRLSAHAAYRSRFRAGRGASIHYEHAEQPLLFEWVERFVAAIGFTGQIAFDFMISPEGRAIPMECNPRATSGVHLLGQGGQLADAILAPRKLLSSGRVAKPSPGAGGAMLTAAMLSFGLAQAARDGLLGEWLRAVRTGRDVVFRKDDPRPFAEQFRLLAWTRRIARSRGITLQEASTLDIEWNGER